MKRRHILDLPSIARQALDQMPSPPPETLVLRFGRTAMAAQFEVMLPFGTPRADMAAAEALELIDRLEAQLTVFRPTSEVSRLNRLASIAPVPVDAGLFDLLVRCARLTAVTKGAFDVTAGPIIKAWGFYRRQGRVPADDELAEAMARVGMQHVELDSHRRCVRFLRRGMEINLGSIGKGYALDRAAELLAGSFEITSGLLHGGTSSVLAIGTPPGDPAGWAVGLRHPWEAGRRLATVRLRGRALATSAATYQHFNYNSRKLGHLLDPRSGQPAQGVGLATALASTAAEADALATAFYVLGIKETREYCDEHPDVAAILLPDEPEAAIEVINVLPGDVDLSRGYAEPANDSPWEFA